MHRRGAHEHRNLNKGRAGFDRHHTFVASATYELPMGKGRHFLNHNRVLDFLIGGYDLAWIQTFDDGQPDELQLHQQPV